MKPVIRYRSQLLYRTSYGPNRISRFQTVAKLVVRPTRRFGAKPRLEVLT